MKNQAYNPFLPPDKYIPDGEPHVFDGRVYLYGSHDREGGYTFCMEDYEVFSADVNDLSDWRSEGIIYRAEHDPLYPNFKFMYAPDVVRGNDGKYYLYYAMSGDYGVGGYTNPISVAVCDEPAGKYEYLGVVRNPDGSPMKRYVCFDPAVLNDDGVIRLFYGTQYPFEEDASADEIDQVLEHEAEMFGKSRDELLSYPDSVNGAVMLTLSDDMLTVKELPKHIIPYRVKGTSFGEHPFFEASSMRKVNGKYYFIYSSQQNHELCYAVSDKPDEGFVFGGTIVSNGDIGYHGRLSEDRDNMTGTTHGSIVGINGKWYVFYHRLTHKSDYSRQACAEEIMIEPDGRIAQVELTSCGLNGGPLTVSGNAEYPAVIACNITNGHMPHGSNSIFRASFPNVTNRGDDRFIGEICDGTLIGFKYFDFRGTKNLGIQGRFETPENLAVFDVPKRIDDRCEDLPEAPVPTEGNGQERFEIRLEENGAVIAEIRLSDTSSDVADPEKWSLYQTDFPVPDGKHPLFLTYRGKLRFQLRSILFS